MITSTIGFPNRMYHVAFALIDTWKEPQPTRSSAVTTLVPSIPAGTLESRLNTLDRPLKLPQTVTGTLYIDHI
jgi:hypothetical protein